MICKVHGSLTPFLSGWNIAPRWRNMPILHPLMLVGRGVAESLARWLVSLIWQISLIAPLKYESQQENSNDTNADQRPSSRLRLPYLAVILKPLTNSFLTNNCWEYSAARWIKVQSDQYFCCSSFTKNKTNILNFDQLFKGRLCRIFPKTNNV